MDPVSLLFFIAAAFIVLSKSTGISGVITGVSTVTKSIGKAAEFVLSQYNNARHLEDETGISPVVTLLQAAYESDFATSHVYSQTHNLFSLNASKAWLAAGKPTYTNAALEAQGQNFKVYSSDLESMRDWANLLQTLYPLAFTAAQNGDLDLFFDGLQKGLAGPYATNTSYKTQALALLPSITGALPTTA